jgi:hypothetical protein
LEQRRGRSRVPDRGWWRVLARSSGQVAECPSRKGGGQILWKVRVGEYRIDASIYVAETGETATATQRILVI